jgi:protein-S-isoprenylcysteine O-methyltransferase Ste14
MTAFEACAWLWLAWSLGWAAAAAGAERADVCESRAQRLGHLLPTAAALLLLLWPAPPGALARAWLDGPARWLGTALTAAGLLLTVWARRHLGRHWSAAVGLKREHALVREGPYRWSRHPIYAGFLAAFLGTAAAGGRLSGLVAAALAALVYWRKLRREDALLAERFGAEHERWSAGAGAFWPRRRRD